MYSDDAYVVFTKGGTYWWSRFIHNEISHCYIMIPNDDRFIIYEKTYEELAVYTITDYSDILAESIVIKANQGKSTNNLFMLNTCVGQVKQYLGIKNPFIWTPYQLLKRLKHAAKTKET